MTKLPVIVGFGGVNAAGRSAFHHGYRRMVETALPDQIMAPTWQSLAQMMGLDTRNGLSADLIETMRQGTLVRRIEKNLFDVDAVVYQHKAEIDTGTAGMAFTARRSQLPKVLPDNWQIIKSDGKAVTVQVMGSTTALFPEACTYPVSSAGQVPSGFDAARLYRSMHHPRALSYAVYGASDALHSMGMQWQEVMALLQPDQVSVYAGSALGQVDSAGYESLFQNSLTGGRTSSKMMAL
ncbi:MAG: beta-ketoacyl synthase, partial [Natronospirillum sp.]